MGIISLEKASQLVWMGRYSERVYTTLRMFFKQVDKMIESETEQYTEFCNKINIPVIYTSNEDFIDRYLYDEGNPDSILSNLTRAYDNAIVLRDEIGTETLSYLQLCLTEMQYHKIGGSPVLELQNVVDMLLAFWACADDYIVDGEIRNLIKAGRSIERLDLYLRLGYNEEMLFLEYQKLNDRLERSGIAYEKLALLRFSYLLQCEKEDHPESDEASIRRRMLSVLETILDF